MNNTTEFGSEDMDGMDDEMTPSERDYYDDQDDSYVPPPPPTPKEQFKGLIDQIQMASRLIDTAYATMIAQARPFDKDLVAKLEGAQKADRALFDYVQSKMERGDDVPPTVVSGLLGR